MTEMFSARAPGFGGVRRYARLTAAFVLAAVLAGCNATSSSFNAISDRAEIVGNKVGSYFRRDPGVAQQVPLFIASTRQKGDSHGELVARFSLQNVSVPAGHRAGEIEAPSFGSAAKVKGCR